MTQSIRIARDERGTALIESALVLPLLLLIMVGIFEMGRAYQTFQVLTNAAREGARASVVVGGNEDTVTEVVQNYLRDGHVPNYTEADIAVNRGATMLVNGQTVNASLVTVTYPFEFIVLQPVASLVASDTEAGEAFSMQTSSLMRNEAQ